MPEDTVKTMKDYSYTQNRELSWLRFNRRVLEEAADQTVPLLERLKFISIFTSNLDEFFMIRVGSLFDLAAISNNKERDNKSGMSPREQLRCVYETIPPLIDLKNHLYESLCTQLEEEGIVDVSMDQLTEAEQQYVSRYYAANVLPTLSPQIVDSHHPLPPPVTNRRYIYGRKKIDFLWDLSPSLPPCPLFSCCPIPMAAISVWNRCSSTGRPPSLSDTRWQTAVSSVSPAMQISALT